MAVEPGHQLAVLIVDNQKTSSLDRAFLRNQAEIRQIENFIDMSSFCGFSTKETDDVDFWGFIPFES